MSKQARTAVKQIAKLLGALGPSFLRTEHSMGQKKGCRKGFWKNDCSKAQDEVDSLAAEKVPSRTFY